MAARDDTLTYAEIGATRSEVLPAGYRHVRRQVSLGVGDGLFTAVVAGMRNWGIHRQAGLRLRLTTTTPEVGSDFCAGLPLLVFTLWVPCRVVWVRDEASFYGYGFGTLRGHPECGEEAFMVSIAADGRVCFALRAFSRPVSWAARLGGTGTKWLQNRITDRYVTAARGFGQH
jgi:uncharacterized protein (UPF0548 family)